MNLAVRIGKLKLKNPVMAASGTFGEEYKELVRIGQLGAIVAKTITMKARIGNPPPRVAETPSGMLNSIGLENKGAEDFIKNKLPSLKAFKIPVVASIAGDDEDEFERIAKFLTKAGGIDALELNLSCPNIMRGKGQGARGKNGQADIIAQDERAVYKIVKAVRKATDLTVIAKLSPNVTDIKPIAKAAEAGGADAVSLVNTLLGMAIDIETKKPLLGNMTGGLSGPAIKPVALRMVWEAHKAIDIPIIGMGGIIDYKDAIEFMLCGAMAVQVGTASFVNPAASTEIIEGIKKYLKKNSISDVKNIVGALKLG